MKYLILSLIFLSSGFIGYGQTDSIPKTKSDSSVCAWLYVYRNRNFQGSAIGYDLHVNDSVVCRVKNNSKYAIPLTRTGKTEVWAKSEQRVGFTIDVKCGKTYYIKCGVKFGLFVGRPDMSMIAPEQGEVEYNSVKGRD